MIPIMKAPNPLDGVVPGLGPLADALGPKIMLLLGIVWFVALCAAVVFLIIGIVGAASAAKRNDPDGMSHAALKIAVPALTLVALAILPLIVGSLLS